jgi:hypothetical protein
MRVPWVDGLEGDEPGGRPLAPTEDVPIPPLPGDALDLEAVCGEAHPHAG